MADDAVLPSTDESLSPNSGIQITMDEDSENSEEIPDENGEEDFEIDTNDLANEANQILQGKSNDLENTIQQVLGLDVVDLENNGVDLDNNSENILEFGTNSDQILEIPSNNNNNENSTDGQTQTDDTHEKSYVPPLEGMEFESYDDAYNYYNCYAKELGFGIRVKSSWTKRNSKEKRGAVLSCNCEGFKTVKEASTRRKDTRTGCQAMVRLRLVESNRWRLDEVKLEHNHLFDRQRAQNSRSHKSGSKRKLESSPIDVEVQTIKLYRTPVVDVGKISNDIEFSNHVELSKRLKLKNGDFKDLDNYFRETQLVDPNFFYIMDLNDEGYLRNVFWIDSRSRAAYNYFGDVVLLDTRCVSNKHDVPLVSFSGLDHHGESVLFGCGLLVDESTETYIWLMRAWLTCMSGRTPQTIITDQCTALRGAISEVFPRAHHRLCLPLVMQSFSEKLGGKIGESEVFQTVLNRIVYSSMKVEEFEKGWDEMTRDFDIQDHEFVKGLYEDRERWVPVFFSKDAIFAGIYVINPFFDGFLRDRMSLNEFFDTYELLQLKKIEKESRDDFESREFRPVLKTSCGYELQVSGLYTKEIFLKFQDEVALMSSCFSVTQINGNGPITTYMVKERDSTEGDSREAKSFEIVYDKVGIEVRCICSCFNFRGYLCKHALTVLNYNGVEEIPSHYVLTRWRKDVKRLYLPDLGSDNIDVSNPVQWFDHLYRRAMQVVGEGVKSEDHHMVAWQAFKECLNKVRLVADKPV